MNKLITSVIVAGLVTLTAFGAEAKERKPVLCMNFTETKLPVDEVLTPVAICTDGKRPVVLLTFTKVTILDEGGVKVPAVVGYR